RFRRGKKKRDNRMGTLGNRSRDGGSETGLSAKTQGRAGINPGGGSISLRFSRRRRLAERSWRWPHHQATSACRARDQGDFGFCRADDKLAQIAILTFSCGNDPASSSFPWVRYRDLLRQAPARQPPGYRRKSSPCPPSRIRG